VGGHETLTHPDTPPARQISTNSLRIRVRSDADDDAELARELLLDTAATLGLKVPITCTYF
jgi:hypothetical protein